MATLILNLVKFFIHNIGGNDIGLCELKKILKSSNSLQWIHVSTFIPIKISPMTKAILMPKISPFQFSINSTNSLNSKYDFRL